MQRLNKSGHAPLGAAFFLFLGVAIVPVSLSAVGIKIGFNPSLSAAANVWEQIAGVFGAGYRPDAEARMTALNNTESESPVVEDETPGCADRKLAFLYDAESPSKAQRETVASDRPKAVSLRAPRTKQGRASLAAERFDATLAVPAIQASLHEIQEIEALRTIKIATKMREGLLRIIEQRLAPTDLDPTGKLMRTPSADDFSIVTRTKPAKTPAAASKAAACKVRAAFSDGRRNVRARTYSPGLFTVALPIDLQEAEM